MLLALLTKRLARCTQGNDLANGAHCCDFSTHQKLMSNTGREDALAF